MRGSASCSERYLFVAGCSGAGDLVSTHFGASHSFSFPLRAQDRKRMNRIKGLGIGVSGFRASGV